MSGVGRGPYQRLLSTYPDSQRIVSVLPDGLKMSETRVIKIQDICNVKPIIKRREVSWNSVYQFVSGLSGEYILNNVDSKKEPDLHNYLSPLFMDSNLSAEEWYLGLKNFEAMDGFLDAIDFQNNTSSFDRLCDRLE